MGFLCVLIMYDMWDSCSCGELVVVYLYLICCCMDESIESMK